MIVDLVNQINVHRVVPGEWKLSTITNCCEGKGDALEGGNYRGLILTDQLLKIAERVIKKLIRQQVDIDEKQFVFMSECGITNAIFILRQLQEKCLTKKKNSHFAFLDLEKAFYRLSRDVIWALRNVGVEEWLVKTVQSMYRNGQSRVRVNGTFSDDFLVQVVLHQGSA